MTTLTRKQMLLNMNFESFADLPDNYIYALHDYHIKLNDVNNKEHILLEFINTLLEKNNAPKLLRLVDFINIYRENLLFDNIPENLEKRIKISFDMQLKKKVDEENSGGLYIKNMVKQLPNYEFITARKDIFIVNNGVKVKKPMMVYSIAKNN